MHCAEHKHHIEPLAEAFIRIYFVREPATGLYRKAVAKAKTKNGIELVLQQQRGEEHGHRVGSAAISIQNAKCRAGKSPHETLNINGQNAEEGKAAERVDT